MNSKSLLPTDKTNSNKLAFLLLIPILIFYIGYIFNYAPGYKPTGYIQYDNISYAAYAKQYTDHTGSGISYSNPHNDSDNYNKIYFQTQTLMLGALIRLGIAPGVALCLFSLLFCFLAIRTVISVFDELYPDSQHRNKLLVMLVWGGGLFALGCMALRPFMSTSLNFWNSIYYLDPEDGWWGLNFGRSLIFGTESYYHFLFFSSVLFLFRKQWIGASLTAFILSFSHPFTGIHLLLLLLTWISVEKVLYKNKEVPWWLFITSGLLIVLHLSYYLIYLPGHIDHKSVNEQYAVNWNYWHYRAIPAFIPAYILVFTLFMISIRVNSFRNIINNSKKRLFICLAIVSILLCNHDLFIKPMQPIHFARGYEWTSYFLLGVPALIFILNKIQAANRLRWVTWIIIFVMVSDNLLWITNYVKTPRGNETTISNDQQEVIDAIKPITDNTTLIIGGDLYLMPYCLVYTKGYAWISHPYTTPFFKAKKTTYDNFILEGKIDSAWLDRKVILVFDKSDSLELKRASANQFTGKELLNNRRYNVWMGRFPKK